MDWLGRRFERPAIDIQTSDSGHLVKFKIRISKGTVDSVALNYPVVGVIGPLSDENDVTVARTAVARAVGGATENALQNNFQLFITDIESGQNLEYSLSYTPSDVPATIASTDEYKLSYVWKYQGEKIEESEWRSVKNDQIVREPAVLVWGSAIYHRVLTPEEIEKHFREGTPKRPLE